MQCETCGLKGPTKERGRFMWLDKIAAARRFYRLANKVDLGLVVLFLLCSLGCQLIVDESKAADNWSDNYDSGDGSDSSDTVDTTDTEPDTETETVPDTETDTVDGECPWECRPRLTGINWPFSCSDPWQSEPTAVVNKRFDCPVKTDYCCQPWPAPDHPMAVDAVCIGDLVCESNCSSGIIVHHAVCFDASHWCCEEPRK